MDWREVAKLPTTGLNPVSPIPIIMNLSLLICDSRFEPVVDSLVTWLKFCPGSLR